MIALARESAAVAATLTPSAAESITWQVVIVGAGPAGSATARRLAARGVRVLVVDRHALPRPKVCGCCLSPRALRELHGLGPAGMPEAAIRLDAVRLDHRGLGVRIPLPAAAVVSRDLLDPHLLRNAIAVGCDWLPGLQVASIDVPAAARAPFVTVVGTAASGADATPVRIRADRIVLATGLADQVRIATDVTAPPARGERRVETGSRIGLGGVLPADACDLPFGELVMAVGRHGYCGLVRLEDGRIDVAAAVDRAAFALASDPARVVARLLAESVDHRASAVPGEPVLRAAAFRATPPLTRRAPLVDAAERLLRVGDAAGYVEPFTGEGIGWALGAARVLAEALLADHGLRSPAEAAARYRATHRREFASSHARCRLVAGSLRRPTVVAVAVAAARALPWVAGRLVPAVIGGRGHGGAR